MHFDMLDCTLYVYLLPIIADAPRHTISSTSKKARSQKPLLAMQKLRP